ncbi:hypothetical protein MicB006_1971 [Micromonospora sp. B006]|nr:hypothetical protein MicB006_1971 [Micromonospora sp. B006]
MVTFPHPGHLDRVREQGSAGARGTFPISCMRRPRCAKRTSPGPRLREIRRKSLRSPGVAQRFHVSGRGRRGRKPGKPGVSGMMDFADNVA